MLTRPARLGASDWQPPDPDTVDLDTFAAEFGAAGWVHRRVILQRLHKPSHARFVEVVGAAARGTDPATQLAVAEALERIGSPAAEMTLILLLDSDAPAVRRTAAEALAKVGGRAALGALNARASERTEERAVRVAASEALEAVRARLPPGGEAASGGLSLASDDAEGGLSLGPTEGGLSVTAAREDVGPAALAPPAAGEPLPAAAPPEAWMKLAPPPRPIPRGLQAVRALSGNAVVVASWMAATIGGLTSLLLPWNLYPELALVTGWGTWLGLWVVGVRSESDRNHLLRHGVGTAAELSRLEHKRGWYYHRHYSYTFDLLSDSGTVHKIERYFVSRRWHYEDDPLEPVLFDAAKASSTRHTAGSDAVLMLADLPEDVRLDASGQLTCSWGAARRRLLLAVVPVVLTVLAVLRLLSWA